MATAAKPARSERGRPFWERRDWNLLTPTNEQPPDPTETELACTLSAERFSSEDGSFAIWTASARGESCERPVTIKGPLARATAGEMLSCKGRWTQHARHGWAFEVTEYRSALPTSPDGIGIWLERRVAGVGPVFAKAIVAHFGAEQVFATLDEDPTRLREVRTAAGRRISEKQVEAAIVAWDDVKALRQIESFLFSHGVSAGLADKLYRRYGGDVITILEEEPYRITELHGIGFRIADRIARSLGTPLDDPSRIRAGLVYVLEEAEAQAGHVYLTLEQLLGMARELLEVDDNARIIERAGELAGAREIVVENDEEIQQRVYLRRLWVMECRLAQNIRRILETPLGDLFRQPKRPSAPPGASTEEIEALRLPTDDQWSVVELVRTQRLALLLGGPGVGKTATTVTLCDIAANAGKRIALAAPTGKAARRMTELTGRPASTIHRLLEFSPMQGFQRTEQNPIEADLLVVDEASMLSLDLADALFRAIGPRTHVLLVGDPDQLPPVGAGRVLADLIASEAVPLVHLARIFRQAARSMIVQNSRRINSGKVPYTRHDEAEAELGYKMLRDFYFVSRKTHDETRRLVVEMACERIPRMFGLDPVTDIMVLAPIKKGPVGLEALNRELEERLNRNRGTKPRVVLASRGISVGSRIVQTKNDYTEGREVMNGEIAIVKDYNDADKEALLSLDDGEREIWVPTASMDTYQLAWALTTHKSQGSEFKAVVVPVSTAHFVMLSRALLYTAVTRATDLCVMVGEKKALHIGVQKVDMRKRNSLLAARILNPILSGELF